MMDVEAMIESVIGKEGGYSNHAADRGGATRWGITETVARRHGYDGTMRALPRDAAIDIYRALYWDKPGFERVADVAPAVAAELFDTGVNMGPAAAIGFFKRALNALNRGQADYADTDPAPVIDAATIAALKAFLAKRGREGEDVLIKAMNALQGERYIVLAEKRPANEAFVYGWLKSRVE
jgi:lysozyme family protein